MNLFFQTLLPSDFLEPQDWQGDYGRWPRNLLDGMRVFREEAESKIRDHILSLKRGGYGPPSSGKFDYFSQGGTYRFVPDFPQFWHDDSDDVTERLSELFGPEEMKLLIFANRSFLIASGLFTRYRGWLCCALGGEALFVLPPNESWLLVWDHSGAESGLYRKNPDAVTFFLDVSPEVAEALIQDSFPEDLELPMVGPINYPAEGMVRIRMDYPAADLPSPIPMLDDCSYYRLSPAARKRALQICRLSWNDMILDAIKKIDNPVPVSDFPFGWKDGSKTWYAAVEAGEEKHPVWVEAHRLSRHHHRNVSRGR